MRQPEFFPLRPLCQPGRFRKGHVLVFHGLCVFLFFAVHALADEKIRPFCEAYNALRRPGICYIGQLQAFSGRAEHHVRCEKPTVLLNQGYIPQRFLIVGDTNGEHLDSLTIAEKGHAHLKLVARGKGGHSSIPWMSDNPIPKLTEGYAKILAALPKNTANEDHWRDYLTATRLFGSEANNIIPDTASMNFSYRFIEPDGPQKMKAFIENLTGLEVVLPETWRPPVISDPNDPYISSLFAAMCRKWPDRNIRYTKMSCATDATRYVHLKLPTVIFGANGYGAHASDERVSLSSLIEYTQMFTSYLKSQIK